MKTILQFASFLMVSALVTVAAEPLLELSDVNGRMHKPLVVGVNKAVVLIFISRDCPISNAFVPEMNRLSADYEKGIAFYLVQADLDITGADAKKHAEIFAIKAPVLLDPDQRLVKLTKAKSTPEAVVLGASGETLYQGRINDLYASLTKKRPEPTTRDLRDALDAVLLGRAVTNASTKAIGCSIAIK